MSEVWPPRAANLLLCEYAAVIDGTLQITRGGLIAAPPSGTPWFLAGTLGLQRGDLQRSAELSICLEGTDELATTASGSTFKGDLEFDVEVRGSLEPHEMILLPFVIPMPPARLLLPGAYDLVVSLADGALVSRTNFSVAGD